MHLGQVEQLLHAVAETDAEPFAAADCDQRLRELPAGLLGIGPGIGEAQHAQQTVGRHEHEDGQRRADDRDDRAEILQARTAEKQHEQRDHHQDRGRAEIRLEQQQQADQRERNERNEQALEAALQRHLAAHDVARQIHDGPEARGLRGLQAEDAEVDPAPSMVDLDADARHQHEHEQEQSGHEQQRTALLPGLHRHDEHEIAEQHADRREHELALEEVEGRAGHLLADRDRGRGHHDQAPAQQHGDRDDQRRVEAVACTRHGQREAALAGGRAHARAVSGTSASTQSRKCAPRAS